VVAPFHQVKMNIPLAIITDMTKPSAAISVYVAIALVIVLFLWFSATRRVPPTDKSIVLCLTIGLWFYSDATARNWQKLTLQNGKTMIMDLYVQGHAYAMVTSILGVILMRPTPVTARTVPKVKAIVRDKTRKTHAKNLTESDAL